MPMACRLTAFELEAHRALSALRLRRAAPCGVSGVNHRSALIFHRCWRVALEVSGRALTDQRQAQRFIVQGEEWFDGGALCGRQPFHLTHRRTAKGV